MEYHQRGFLVFIICFLRSFQVSHSSGLTIDNQLVIIANDCYTRVAIGFKLPDMDIFSSVAVGSISECEDECSKRRNSCNAFTFGISIKGNGTCALSRKMPKPEELQTHADYDVYVRSQRSLHCEPDRLYKMRSGGIGERGNETKSTVIFGSGLSDPTISSILSSSRNMGSTMHVVNDPSYQQGYMNSLDDERRISDILRNRNSISPASSPFRINNVEIDNDLSIYPNRKSVFDQQIYSDPNYDLGRPSTRNPFDDINYLNFESNSGNDRLYKPLTVHNGFFDILSRPIFAHETSKNKSPVDFKFWIDPTKDRNIFTSHHQHQNQGYFNNMHRNHEIIMRPKQNELVTGSYDIDKMSQTVADNFETDGTRISTGRFKDTYDIRNAESWIFRGFDARIADKCAILAPGQTETRISVFNEACTKERRHKSSAACRCAYFAYDAYVRRNLIFFYGNHTIALNVLVPCSAS